MSEIYYEDDSETDLSQIEEAHRLESQIVDRIAPVKRPICSKIYYREEFRSKGFQHSYSLSSGDFEGYPKVFADNSVPFQYGDFVKNTLDIRIDLQARQAVFDKHLSSGPGAIQRRILTKFNELKLPYTYIENSDVQSVLNDSGIAFPLPTEREQVKRNLDVSKELMMSALEKFVEGRHTVQQLQALPEFEKIDVKKLIEHVRRFGRLPYKKPTKISRERVVLPSAAQVRKLLVENYRKNKRVGVSWGSLIQQMKTAFPQISAGNSKTLENKIRTQFGVKALKSRLVSSKLSVELLAQLEMGLGMLVFDRLERQKPILFVDQTTFRWESDSLKALGTRELIPCINVSSGRRELHAMCAFDANGMFAMQVTQQSFRKEMFLSFFDQVIPQYKAAVDSPDVDVFLDNVPYQKNQTVTKLAKHHSARLIYGIPGAPFINVIENLFLHTKRLIREKKPSSYEQMLDLSIPCLILADSLSKLCFEKFYQDLLECSSKYHACVDPESASSRFIRSGKVSKLITRITKQVLGST